MARQQIIADTGVIVGLINAKDQSSRWSREAARDLPAPYFTCESVISEACFLLRSVVDGPNKVLELIELGAIKINFSLNEEVSAVRTLMNKYANVPMSLADACLVRMSELIDDSAIFTVDSDFLIYQKDGRKKIPLIAPF